MIPFGVLQQQVAAVDPYFSNVTLLIHADGINNSNAYLDYSTKEHLITPTGTVMDTSEKKFGTSSAWFDDSDDYLTMSYVAADFDWEPSDFTIEFWVKPFGASWTGWQSASGRPTLIGRMSPTSSTAQWMFGILDDGSLTFTYNNGAAVQLETTTKVPTAGWSHCAMVNDGGTIKLFINGVLELSAAISGTPITTSDNFLIGKGNTRNIHGWLDDIRITKGVARYTGNFSVPTAAFPDTYTPLIIDPDADAYYVSNVSLTLHCDGADTSTTFTDSSVTGHTVTPSGNAQMDTAQSKSGGASALFDGSGDYLSVSYITTDFDWFSDDYTLEYWVRTDSSWTGWDDGRAGGTHPCVIGRCDPTGTTDYWNFGPIDTGKLRFRYYNGSSQVVDSVTTLPTGEWVHCALVVDGTLIRLFINGVPDTVATIQGTPQSVAQNLTIGSNNSNSIPGWLDDMRITKGVARYRGPFTPLATAFPDSPPITADLHSWWTLEEDVSNKGRVNSHKGATPMGYWAGTVGSATGKFAGTKAADFTSGALGCYTAGSGVSTTGSFSVAGWIYLDNVTSYQALMARADNAANSIAECDWQVYIDNVGKATIRVASGGTFYYAVFGSACTISTWHHITAYYDADQDEIGISMDGADYITAAVTGAMNTGGDQFKMGRLSSASSWQHYLNGRMQEWGYWEGRRLYDADKAWLYNSGNGRQYADLGVTQASRFGLTGWWSMDEASGNTRLNGLGTGLDFTENGVGIPTGTGKHGNSIHLAGSGASNLVLINSLTALSANRCTFSTCGWVKFDTVGSDQCIFARSDNAANANNEIDWKVHLDGADDKLCMSVHVGSTAYTAKWGSAATTATWYFVYAYYDEQNDEVGISINDGTTVTAAVTGIINTGGDRNTFGRQSYQASWDDYVDGELDEWGHYFRKLDSAIVTEIYNSGAGKDLELLLPLPG
jgi:hypothetical protein